MIKDKRVKKVSVGLKIRKAREDRHMSLNELARESDVNAGQLSRIERGSFPPKLNTLRKIQHGLGLTDEQLLNILGFKSVDYSKYKQVPVIGSDLHGMSFSEALSKARTVPRLYSAVPRDCFMLTVCDSMAPLIRKGTKVIVNRHYGYENFKIYAIRLHDKILVGRVLKSKNYSEGVLVTSHHAYFSCDYKNQFDVLGRVVKIIDNV